MKELGTKKEREQRQRFVGQLRGVFMGGLGSPGGGSLELGGIIIPELGIGSQDKGPRRGILQYHGRG